MKKLLMLLLGLSLFAVYISNASFAYFSDSEMVEVSIQAGEWGQGVSVLYPCPYLLIYCRSGGGGSDFTGLNFTPFGAERLDPSKVQNIFAQENYSIGVPSDGSSVQCHNEVCIGYLGNIWLYPESNVTLERVRISWTGGGRLRAFWVGNYKVGGTNQTSTAEFHVGKELRGGCLYPVTFKFRGIGLQDEYEFTITFFFSNGHSRTIHFRLGDGD
ncbi:SipW-dependent-type signal peptide-containing protein [Thermococcus profundus]|nr:SipW-dependent-type signal peptide-containing protein [Thermococcus profundus]